MPLADLPPEALDGYEAVRELPDGRVIALHRLLFHWTVLIDIDYCGYADRYCFATRELAEKVFNDWDGIGEPEGWHRHPKTGRRRNLATGEEWVEM